MKFKATFLGVLLPLIVTTSHATDAEYTSPSARNASAQNATPVVRQQTTPEMIRAAVTRLGIDPDSPKGQILTGFMNKVSNDPQLQTALRGRKWPPHVDLSPASRLEFLQLFKGIHVESPDDCLAMQTHQGDFAEQIKLMSPHGLQLLIDLVQFPMKHSRTVGEMEESYTTAELLEVEAGVDSLPELKAPGTPTSGMKYCQLLGSTIDAVVAMPETSQRIATFLLLKKIEGDTVGSATVLADPYAYLDEAFDERALPQSIQQGLPPSGSRPLPFARLAIQGQWVNELKPAAASHFLDTYINRHNNGVLSELLVPVSPSGQPDYAQFTLNFGIEMLRSQDVGKNTTHMAEMPDSDRWIQAANQSLVEGETIAFPLPQPMRDGAVVANCRVGGTRAASTVFASLHGPAVDLKCTSVDGSGKVTEEDDNVWLPEYQLTLNTSWRDDSGTTRLVIDKITITR
jgi:hypothetical protein